MKHFCRCLNMSKDSLTSIKMYFFSGGLQVYSSLCAHAAGRMCPLHIRTHPHTLHTVLNNLGDTFLQDVYSLVFAACILHSLRFGDAHAEQSECAHMLVCLGFARCWKERCCSKIERSLSKPHLTEVLSGAKQTIWHLDLVQSEHIKGGENVLNGVFEAERNPVNGLTPHKLPEIILQVKLKSLRCIAVINILNGNHPFQNDELVFN